MYKRIVESFFPNPVKYPTYFILVVGIFVIFTSYAIGLGIVAVCLAIITANEGIMIDFEKGRFKSYWSVMLIRVGKWEPIPKFGRLLLVPELTQFTGTSFSLRTTEYTKKETGVRLYYLHSNDYILASKGKIEKTRKDAEFLAQKLKLKLEDYSAVKISPESEKKS
ncbi:MAG: hypothetical protein ACNS62_13090 [Candidatus Cyclobacteriaceae bacterium M3_2C_046]